MEPNHYQQTKDYASSVMKEKVEDEFHFLMQRPFYSEERASLLEHTHIDFEHTRSLMILTNLYG